MSTESIICYTNYLLHYTTLLFATLSSGSSNSDTHVHSGLVLLGHLLLDL